MSLKHFHFNILDIFPPWKSHLVILFSEFKFKNTFTPMTDTVLKWSPHFWDRLTFDFQCQFSNKQMIAVPVWTKITSYKFIIIWGSSSFPHDSHFSASTRSDTVTVSIVTSFNFAIMGFLPLSLGLSFIFLLEIECRLFLAHNFTLKFLSHWCMINTLVEINGTCTSRNFRRKWQIAA